MSMLLKEQALEAFLRELPELMKERPGEFVAYRGAQRLGFSKVKHLLYQDCMERGYDTEEFLVFCIEPWETEWYIPNATLGEPGDALHHWCTR